MSILAASLALVGAAAPMQATDDVLRTYVTCAAKHGGVAMHSMLDTTSESEYRTAASDFSDVQRCVRQDEAATAVLFATYNENRGKLRGMIAEVLLKRSKTVARLAPLGQAKSYNAGWFTMTGRPHAVDEMAACVAAVDPAGIRTLLATQPGSAGQRLALGALTPSLGTCLAKGYQLDTRPPGLRAALAEALYQRDAGSAQ